MSSLKIGIDAGGTLIKLAYEKQGTIHYQKFDSHNLQLAADWINNQCKDAQVCITGGKGAQLQSLLHCGDVRGMVEFDATCRGIRYLLQSAGTQIDSYILTNVGTGTSIHYIDLHSHTRVGGTGVGGGTIIGLSILLTRIEQYDQIVQTARKGQRRHIDLTVGDIYKGAEPPLFGDLTASNFGKIRTLDFPATTRADLLAAIIGLVGETVTTASILAAEKQGTANIVYIGSSFIDNDILKEIISSYSLFKGTNPVFVKNGEFSGAIGALGAAADWPNSGRFA